MNKKIIGVDIFLEKRKTRVRVGDLTRINNDYIFVYDDHYFKSKNSIPLGPKFPLTQKKFISNKLFPSLKDRIPQKENPAYEEYCLTMGISPDEIDELILLSTIGRKGPSSFIFYPIYERKIDAEKIIAFRKNLDLTTREFAKVFEISQTSLNALERKRIIGHEILKRLEIILNYPNVALDFLLINGGVLIDETLINATKKLKSLLKE